MRAVHLPAGKHEVVFRFTPSEASVRVSMAGFGLGALAFVALVFLRRSETRGPLDDPETSKGENTSSLDEPTEPSPRKSQSRSGRRKKR